MDCVAGCVDCVAAPAMLLFSIFGDSEALIQAPKESMYRACLDYGVEIGGWIVSICVWRKI